MGDVDRDRRIWDEDRRVWLYWPFCQVPGCPNRVCLAKGETRFCWPHSSSGKTLDEVIDEANATPTPARDA